MSRRSQREYEGDVDYHVWLQGGNPDAIDRDRVADHWYAGDEEDAAVRDELRHQRRVREPEQEPEQEQEP